MPSDRDHGGSFPMDRMKICIGAPGVDDGDVSSSTPFPVTMISAGTVTNRSGTITSGGTSQQLAAANTARKYLYILNISDTIFWINFGTAAVADSPSIPLKAATSDGAADGGSITFDSSFVPSAAIHIIGATTGKKFVAKEG